MKVVALAGGVGGAKLATGLAGIIPGDDLTIIVNTGDDFQHFGLNVCPDLDTVCYNLAGIENPETGWGLRDETWNTMRRIENFGGPTWFRLGDNDLATHLERTRRLSTGAALSQVTREFCKTLGVKSHILPMSDDPVRTKVITQKDGELYFQEYFVHRRCEPEVASFKFDGIENSRPAPGVLEAIGAADLIVICPSNPWVSIDPILAVPGIRRAIAEKSVLAVSPIIGGKTVKGPAAKMYSELGISPSALAVARHYKDFISGFVIDEVDRSLVDDFSAWSIILLVTNTLMYTSEDRFRLADEVLRFGSTLIRRQ